MLRIDMRGLRSCTTRESLDSINILGHPLRHQGKGKLQKAPPQNNQGTCTSVRIDLSIPITDDNLCAYQAVTESLVLDWLSVEIFTIGQPMHECDFCGALMWYEERSEKTESLVLDYRGLTHHKKIKDLNIGELLAEGGGDEDGDPNMAFNLMTVAGTRNAAFLEELLRARLDLDNGDSKGRTPLHIAASRGHEECNRAVGRGPTCLGQTVCVFVAIWSCMIGQN